MSIYLLAHLGTSVSRENLYIGGAQFWQTRQGLIEFPFWSPQLAIAENFAAAHSCTLQPVEPETPSSFASEGTARQERKT